MLLASNAILKKQVKELLNHVEDLDGQVQTVKVLLNPLTLTILASEPFQDLSVNKVVALLEILLPNMLFLHQLVTANGPIGSPSRSSPFSSSHL